MAHLAIVSPVYKARECVDELHRRLVEAASAITDRFEIVLVEDFGRDGSWERMVEIAAGDPRVKLVKMSRNFGQHTAISAGLDVVDGDWVVVMDCDLQDRPEEIAKLYAKAQEGHDVVFARRFERIDSLYRRFVSWAFIKFYNYLGDIRVDNSTANFSIVSRRVVDNLRLFRERNRSYPMFVEAVGFKKTVVDVEHASRFAGKSSYSFAKLLDFAIQCIVAQSNKPLRLSIKAGFSLALASGAYAAWLVFRYFYHGVSLQGWTSIMVLISFFFGLLFANLGVVGLYVGKIFDEVKGRPLYTVECTMNLEQRTLGASVPRQAP